MKRQTDIQNMEDIDAVRKEWKNIRKHPRDRTERNQTKRCNDSRTQKTIE
jgi:hypothetical protein